MEKLISIRQFAEKNGIGRSTVYREHDRGHLRFVKIGRATRIRESDAIAWQERLEQTDPDETAPDASDRS